MSSRSFDDGCGLSVLFQGWSESENKSAGSDVLHVDVLHLMDCMLMRGRSVDIWVRCSCWSPAACMSEGCC